MSIEPRIPRPSGALPQPGVRHSSALLGAIPSRFRLAWQQAEEPLVNQRTEALSQPTALTALL
jgi:hypothetical protein